ncbi:hypothetical protein CKO51_22990 [Rhodopirellula sp. SM50]|nr:hypothetical protein CKO51_22990 [Rhodopirellula sp. SM50]
MTRISREAFGSGLEMLGRRCAKLTGAMNPYTPPTETDHREQPSSDPSWIAWTGMALTIAIFSAYFVALIAG